VGLPAEFAFIIKKYRSLHKGHWRCNDNDD